VSLQLQLQLQQCQHFTPTHTQFMVGTVAVALGVQGLLPVPLVALMFGRDLALVAGSIVHRLRTKGAGEGFFDVAVSGLPSRIRPSLTTMIF
jgi:hypothetical protein